MQPLQKAARQYLPRYPRQSWQKNCWQIVLIVGAFLLVFGTTGVLVRAHEVDASKHSHSRMLAEDKLYGMLKGEEPLNESAVGRLARKLEDLMRPGELPLDNLQKYYVNAYELEAARKQLGWDFFSYTYPSSECETDCTTNKEGYFTEDFILKVYSARFEKEPYIYENKVPKIVGSGILQGKWLAVSLVGWLFFGFVCWSYLVVRRGNWEEREIARFLRGLTTSQRNVLEVVGELRRRPSGNYLEHIRKTAWAYQQRLRKSAFSERNDLLERAETLFSDVRGGRVDGGIDNELSALRDGLARIDRREKDAASEDQAHKKT